MIIPRAHDPGLGFDWSGMFNKVANSSFAKQVGTNVKDYYQQRVGAWYQRQGITQPGADAAAAARAAQTSAPVTEVGGSGMKTALKIGAGLAILGLGAWGVSRLMKRGGRRRR